MSKKIVIFIITISLALSLTGLGWNDAKAAEVKVAKPKVSLKSKGDSITVTIKKTENAEDYSIFIKGLNDDKYYIIASVEANKDGSTKHVIKNLVDDTYSIRVRAYNGLTPSKYSKVKSITVDTREASPSWVSKLGKKNNTDQLFVVAKVGDTTAYVSMHEKDANGKWRTVMTTPGVIGKNGLGKTKEGDWLTPSGTFKFNAAFGIEDDPGCALEYKKVTEDDYWSGDSRDGYHYNEMVSIKDYPDLDTENSEHIIDYTVHYKYCLNISYNEECKPGKGSAIFLHCFGPYKPYTAGCVAIPEESMKKVLQSVKENCVVVIDTLENISPATSKEWAKDGKNEEKEFYITEITDEIFERIKGKSFKDNCTVPREDLRYLHVLHKDLDGNTHEGEMIVNYHIAEDVLDILKKLYEADYPIEKIRLVDEYDADDETSMRDNNSSSFNFRFISHTTRVSKHGLGLAVDINTLYNPYTKVVDGERIIEPATGEPYLDRNAEFPYKIDENDLCYKLFIEKGFEWGGAWEDRKDYQHFEIPTEIINKWYPDNA